MTGSRTWRRQVLGIWLPQRENPTSCSVGGATADVLTLLHGAAACKRDRLEAALPRRAQSRRLTNCLHSSLEGQPFELVDGKREQQVDATRKLQECVAERRALRLVVPLNIGGIGHPPMGKYRLPGEYRAGFLGTVAHSNDKIPVLAFQTLHAPRLVARPRDA